MFFARSLVLQNGQTITHLHFWHPLSFFSSKADEFDEWAWIWVGEHVPVKSLQEDSEPYDDSYQKQQEEKWKNLRKKAEKMYGRN